MDFENGGVIGKIKISSYYKKKDRKETGIFAKEDEVMTRR